MKTIDAELGEVYGRLDQKTFGWLPDMDGTCSLYVEPDDEAVELMARGAMLRELEVLKHPIARTDWGALMHMHACPCPGTPREVWDHEWTQQQMQEGW